MTKRRYTLLGASVVMVLGAAVFLVTLVHALIRTGDAEGAAPSAAAALLAAARTASELHPESVIIPSVGVDAKTEDLGVNTAGNMAMPTSFHTVGWYKYGVAPGEVGTAVMYGHLDNGLGLDGVFKNLHEITPGADVQVIGKDGKTLHFTVDRTEAYPYKSVPPEALGGGSNDGGVHLTLITCTDHWVFDTQEGMTYDHRLVVYATLAKS